MSFAAYRLLSVVIPSVVFLPVLTLDGGTGSVLGNSSRLWQYVLVAVLAAIPWAEILFVIPAGIAIGLNPVATGVLAFGGNTAAILLIVLFHQRLTTWWRARRDEERTDTGRSARARRFLDRYGMAGLAFVGPILTGIHLAALIALLVGVSHRSVAGWTTVSLALWSGALTIASVGGLSLLGIA